MKGCPFYQQEAPLISKNLKAPSMSKVMSSKEESGFNTHDNVSQNGDTTNNEESMVPTKRRQRTKKDKPMEAEKDETEEKLKMKDKRKKEQQKKL